MNKVVKITIVLVLSINFCQSQTFNGKKTDIDEILKNTRQFSSFVVASNYQKIADSYTKDAKIFPNRTKILSGNDIINYWTLPEGIATVFHKITQEEITIVDETAYDYGYYEGKTKHKDGRISSWKGKYVIVWKKVDDQWKMYLDIWNSVKEKK
ncbi:YybH family protein [Tenacibaculum agarivorans]|uniref:YybH family protein n=1 Tax=Tenacibaculum agarivorans TaxID=1908389 RepID=UPI00094BBA22|nr:nuclear transport factor 2 family protein [Tenacibaculum agarivorans]